MSFNSWRQFQFFENVPIKDPNLAGDSPLYSDPTLSAVSPSIENKLIIAVQARVIKLIDLNQSEMMMEFVAYPENFQITYLKGMRNNFVISVGEQLGLPCLIKLWKLDKRPTDEFDFHSMIEIKNGKNTSPVSAISISDDLTCIVIGFANGRIVLVRGDILHDRGSRQRVIYEDPTREPITSLFLDRECNSCFAATTSKIYVFSTTGRNSGMPDVTLSSDSGVDLNCSCLSVDKRELICCKKNSLDFYKPNGEKRSLIIDIPLKKRIHAIDEHNIAIVSGTEAPNQTALHVKPDSSNRLIILDTKNMFVTMNVLIASAVIDMFLTTYKRVTSLFLLTSDGTIHKINEKSIDDKLQIVQQKELFTIALELAKQNHLDEKKVQKIRKAYADHLYKNNLKTEAIEEYVKCLDVTETSEIISKFGIENTTSTTDVANLAYYLISMIKKGASNADHISLLLIALVKLKDKEGIDSFISHFSRSGRYLEEPEEEDNWDEDDETYFFSDLKLFDLGLTLKLLKDSGFPTQCYHLARKFSKDPTVIVDILLSTLNDAHSALRYIRSLPVDDTLRALLVFSKRLLDKLPNDTNILLIELFTGKYKPAKYDKLQRTADNKCENDTKKVFYSYKAFMNYMYNVTDKSNVPRVDDIPTYHPPKPALVFTSFINKPFEFLVFLEACLESYNEFQGFDYDKQLILTTLYDIYLSLAKDDAKERRADWKFKAAKVLDESKKLVTASGASEKSVTTGKSHTKAIDNSLMMLISHINDVDLYSTNDSVSKSNAEFANVDEKNLTDAFRSIILTSDSKTVLRFLEKFGAQENPLYVIALPYFLSSKSILKEIGGESALKEKVLKKIMELDLMPILDILQVVGSSNVATFGLVQELLIHHIEAEDEEIRNNQLLVESYQSELLEKSTKLDSLMDKDKPINMQMKNRACHMCHTMLALPIVYFKCGHAYHQRCLNEEESALADSEKLFRCPQCIVELEAAGNMMRAQNESTKQAELLKLALSKEENGKDRFKVITEFIGRGALETSKVIL
ncbi:LAFE_0D06722g1_1 [Lachancea fermentati]|uniref:E3 ubiquitin-protein ligase PEP5 n=1 Tax=Lachancea fermentati TaxID=4955 RepID=A0A1G4MBN5_LACFM|nr:LAFE_0D06722g1_1 [Lachancea fermentati]